MAALAGKRSALTRCSDPVQTVPDAADRFGATARDSGPGLLYSRSVFSPSSPVGHRHQHTENLLRTVR